MRDVVRSLSLILLLSAVGCGDQLPVGPLDAGSDQGPIDDIRRVEGTEQPDGTPNTCGRTAAPDQVHRSIDQDETWGPGRHIVQGRLLVPAGVTLTLEACAEVRFAPASALQVEGRLVGAGLESRVLRLVPDVEVAQADFTTWAGVMVAGQGRVELTNADLVGAEIGLTVEASAEVQLTNVRITAPRRMGLLLEGRVAPGSSGLTILESGDIPVAAAAGSVASLPDGSYTGNTRDLIEVLGGSVLNTTASWRPLGVPYRISNMTIDVATGGEAPDLRVAAGVDLELTGEILVAGGRLSLGGEDSAPVRLVNPDPDPQRKQRASVRLEAPALGLDLQHVRLDGIAVAMSSGELTVVDVIAQRSCGPAFVLTDRASFAASSLDLTVSESTPCDIDGARLPGAPLLIDVGLVASIPAGRYEGNDQDVFLVRGGTLGTNGTWAPSVPLRLLGSVFVEGPDAPVLNVAAGTVVQAGSTQVGLYVGLRAPGTLVAEGDPNLIQPTRFTSSALIPAPGDWVGLVFGPQSGSESHLDGVEVSFAGAADTRRTSCAVAGDGPQAAITLFETASAPVVTRSALSDSAGFGLGLDVESAEGFPDYGDPGLGNLFERNVSADVSPTRDCP